jgi:hypothetical protein
MMNPDFQVRIRVAGGPDGAAARVRSSDDARTSAGSGRTSAGIAIEPARQVTNAALTNAGMIVRTLGNRCDHDKAQRLPNSNDTGG